MFILCGDVRIYFVCVMYSVVYVYCVYMMYSVVCVCVCCVCIRVYVFFKDQGRKGVGKPSSSVNLKCPPEIPVFNT